MRKKLAVEKRQGQTLFGVGFLFIFGHLPRVILNLHEFLFLSNVRNSISNCEEDQTDSALVLLPPWAMVSTAHASTRSTLRIPGAQEMDSCFHSMEKKWMIFMY